MEIYYEYVWDEELGKISVPSSYVIDDVEFAVMCRACPEIYEVFDTNGKRLAYARLRNGNLRLYIPDFDGKLIYHKRFDDSRGAFYDEEERQENLQVMCNLIKDYYEYYC